MSSFKFSKVVIDSFALDVPPYKVSSAEIEDQLAPLYNRLRVPFGTLERLSGVSSRYYYEREERPSEIATRVAKAALDQIGFDREKIGTVFNCSVTRDYFEPATGVLVHQNLGLAESVMALDISNACIGFSNGIVLLANLIETGVVEAGLVVSAENLSRIMDASMKLLQEKEHIDRELLLKSMPTFTLGSGAVAMVLAHENVSKSNRRLLGSVARSASQHSDFCVGNGDFCFTQQFGMNPLMETDSQKLLAAAAKLGGRTWSEASEFLGWSRDDVDHIFCHQVGKQVNAAFYKEMGLDLHKEFTIYKEFGNLVSAALPAALIRGAETKGMKSGDKVLLTAFGSGLNSIFTGITW